MFGFVLSLVVLSITFSLLSGAAFLWRRTVLRGREGLMCPIWIIVLVVSVVPLSFNMNGTTVAAALMGADRHDTVADDAAPDTGNEIADVSGDRAGTDGVKSEPVIMMRARKLLAVAAGQAETISSALCILWLVGAVVQFASSVNGCFEVGRLLDSASMPALDRRVLRLLGECRERLGVRAKVRLRVFVDDAICSPCVRGCLRPCIYLDPGCLELSDEELTCVLSHELMHVRRYDMLMKLLCVFVTSVHWMNPSSKSVRRAVYDDIELACDYGVVRVYGSGISRVYMKTILDFAERFSGRTRLVGAEGMNGGLFLSDRGGAAFLRKRYANMKNCRAAGGFTAAAVVFAMFSVAVNASALTPCSGINPGMFAGAIALSEPLDCMVRAYYGLGPEDHITPGMVDGITSLVISTEKYNDRFYISFEVNGESGYASAVPSRITDGYWDGMVRPALENDDSNAAVKMNAFYTCRDINEPELTERAVEELLVSYPELGTRKKVYYFDPYASRREVDMICAIMDRLGIAGAWKTDSPEFDASSLVYFSNLEEVRFEGMTPVNCELDGVDIVINE